MDDDFYQLAGRPFQMTPDPQFYFQSATHRKAMSYLGYGLAQGEGFIVITGEVGAGKSTLAAHLLATIDRSRLTVGQIVTTRLDAGELLYAAGNAFGLELAGRDKASALAAIEHFLYQEARSDRHCLLVIDEAQNLSHDALEELRMLSNFQLGGQPLVQFLLLGQPEFRDRLLHSPELSQLGQRVVASYHLGVMEACEVRQYIEHRLRCVDWHGNNPEVDEAVFAEVALASGGMPRRVNQICNRLLHMGAAEGRLRLDLAMLQDVLDLLDDDRTAVIAPATDYASSRDRPAGLVAEKGEALAHSVDARAPSHLEAALAVRDELIAELQQAVVELAEMRLTPAAAAPSLAVSDSALVEVLNEALHRINALEARALEQEQTMRHTLTMLIEWIEGEAPQRAAA